MLGESLRVPFRDDDWIGTILVGSVLTLLVGLLVGIWLVVLALSPPVAGLTVPLVALPSLVLRGYLIGVVRSALRAESTTDSFVRWGRLVRDGTRSTLISAVYLIPAAVLAGVALGGGVATVVDPEGFEGAVQAIAAVVILFGGFGLLIYGLVYLCVRPAARAVFAATGSVRAALDVRRVGRLSVTGDYITGWLIGMGVLVVGPTLLLPLLVISLAVAVISPPLAFIGVLSTILLGIVTVFLCRVSAAWATGRGSAEGVADLYPDADHLVESTEPEPTPPVTPSTSGEAPPVVQTGRTVAAGDRPAPPVATDSDTESVVSVVPVQPREGDLSGAPVFPRTDTNEAESVDGDDSTDSDPQLADDAGTDPESTSTDTEPASTESEPAAPDETADPADDSAVDADQSADTDQSAADEDEFVWGPTEE